MLEANGLNLARVIETNDSGFVSTEVHSSWSKGWLARIELSPPGTKYDLQRTFIEPYDMYLSRSGNGWKKYRLSDLSDGFYEADSVWRSMRSHRTYFEVRDHVIVGLWERKALAKEAMIARRTAIPNEESPHESV